ncbi:PREDICTED: protein BTG1-like [Nicrophorus vespilloides]|uniref:Protein BTG1-like n=1 Tax=Nicrophorus vespilloides TaxID=110193 RepID=A0ABM1N341_NICVS|nr:PREDICTED: protein BTG1-like [Nicrophorus vespilloides]XP_017781241.1 PREDICTED: protein BTG1-like [Nicrophorus vespilloides]XP_017781242.1 PREDICTED: protein BTG1-like [Nicrophorus vespilloides]
MKEEILAAVMFLIRFIEKSETFPSDQLENFKHHLTALLTQRFEKHWFPEVPAKGQGYRCIRVNGLTPVDLTLEQAASKCGLKYRDLRLPAELTVWVDPSEVCYRLGESEGSYCTLATFPSESSSECSSPSPSPPTTPLQDKSRRVRQLRPLTHHLTIPLTPTMDTPKHHRYHHSNNAPVTPLRIKPVSRELSFNMHHQNRPPWRCEGPPFPVPQAIYRNMTYNNTRHYKNILRV